MITKTAEYALRATLFLAGRPLDETIRAADIAETLQVPANYLSKILHTLGRAGVVHSERGRHGGFRLARAAGELSLADVIEPFDQLAERRECLLGRAECTDGDPCTAHSQWKAVHGLVTRFFQNTTLADLRERSPATATREGGTHGESD